MIVSTCGSGGLPLARISAELLRQDARCGECVCWHRCRGEYHLSNNRGTHRLGRGVCEDSRWLRWETDSACLSFKRGQPLLAWKTCPSCEEEFLGRAWEKECKRCREVA